MYMVAHQAAADFGRTVDNRSAPRYDINMNSSIHVQGDRNVVSHIRTGPMPDMIGPPPRQLVPGPPPRQVNLAPNVNRQLAAQQVFMQQARRPAVYGNGQDGPHGQFGQYSQYGQYDQHGQHGQYGQQGQNGQQHY
ncbi:hypothetical protein K491DRAFT_313577 [Lophiostoma macrostomum CBS 122681]|uniref:Uncharacterized protein n=1 Tax=Lophiostoma macrostomum CBS 122681 TaxID=1314788 RepID=A0A6A6SHU4_9PLEO|nr:hypothetical protein K491DRAFT_313577 [Lophiostoma macrostomum CBS 122681]